MKKSVPVPAVLVLSALLTSAAAADDLFFEILGTDQGLPNMSVSAIVQDETGFIWFGTHNGVARWDGKTFKPFENDPFDAGTLVHQQVQTMYAEPGALWVGTYGGLDRLDLKTGDFRHFASNPADPASLSNNTVVCVRRDAEGALWVGTLGGLNRLDETTGKFERFLHDGANPDSLPNDVVRCVFSDSAGRLWIGTSGGGLSRYDRASRRFVTLRKDPKNPRSLMSDYVISIAQAADGALWIGTWFGGLSRFDPERETFDNVKIGNGQTYFVDASVPGSVYVGTWGDGLHVYDIATRAIESHKRSDRRGSISNDIVYSMLRDRSGELWFGTNGGGVNKLSRAGADFAVWENDPADSKTLAYGKINAIHRDSRGDFWVGVYGGGLNRLDPKTGTWIKYRHDPKDPRSLPSDVVNVIHETSSGELWIGTYEGLSRFERDAGNFRTITARPGGLSSNNVFAIEDDSDGDLWIGTYNTGLDHWDRKSDTFAHYAKDPKDPGSLSDNLVYDLEFDSFGRLWVATNHGLNRLDGPDFAKFYHDVADPEGIASDSIRRVRLDSAGSLWLATTSGGVSILSKDGAWTHFSRRDGLSSNMVNDVVEDRDRNVWIVTQTGLVKWHRATGLLEDVPLYRRERIRDFNLGTLLDRDGTVCVSTTGAVLRLTEPGAFRNTHVPPVVVTGVKVFNEPRSFPTFAHELDKLELKHYENSVEFSFAALDFRDPERNLYRYMLEGFDKDWIQCGNRSSATYTNLPGGYYRFRVTGSNNDGLWNEAGAELPLRVAQAWWATSSAKVFYAIVVALFIYLVSTAFQRRQLRVKVAELDETRRKLETANADLDTAYREKAALLSEIQHRVKNTMIMIESILGLESSRLDDAQRAALDETVRRVRSITELYGILYRSGESGSVNLADYLGGIVANFADAFVSGDDRVAIRTDLERVTLDFKSAMNLGLVVNELVTNSLKHAFPDGRRGSVELALRRSDGHIELVISDDGIGLPPDFDLKRTTGTGTTLVKLIAGQLHGTIRAFNAGGARFELRIPLPGETVAAGPTDRPARDKA